MRQTAANAHAPYPIEEVRIVPLLLVLAFAPILFQARKHRTVVEQSGRPTAIALNTVRTPTTPGQRASYAHAHPSLRRPAAIWRITADLSTRGRQ